MACPLRSTDITPLPRYYGTVRPCPASLGAGLQESGIRALYEWTMRPKLDRPTTCPVAVDDVFLSILSYIQAWGAETFEDFLKKLRNFQGVAPLDVAAVQHVQGLTATK